GVQDGGVAAGGGAAVEQEGRGELAGSIPDRSQPRVRLLIGRKLGLERVLLRLVLLDPLLLQLHHLADDAVCLEARDQTTDGSSTLPRLEVGNETADAGSACHRLLAPLKPCDRYETRRARG